jgi:molecular chaperone Hsp33
MTSNSPDIKLKEMPVRAPSHVPVDDAVLPFEVASLDLRGRLTRLGPGLDDLLAKHDYPPPVAKLLGEAIVLTTLLGSSLKFNGRFILQTQTDGPVSFLIVDFQAPIACAPMRGLMRRRSGKLRIPAACSARAIWR